MKIIKKIFLVLVAVFLLVFSYFVYLYLTKQSIPIFARKTTGAYYSSGIIITEDPFELNLNNVKLLDRKKAGLTDKLLIADPFLINKDSVFYFFFEIMGRTGADIGVAKVTKDNDLEYLGVAIDEPKHLSYPMIFEEEGKMYMIPESKGLNGVRLYEATNFPMSWSLKKEIIPNVKLADPTIIKRDDTWYLFAEKNQELHLFFADSLTGSWTEHPMSPVKKGNYTRPAGRIFEYNTKTIRFGQDAYGSYGRQVYGFYIDELTRNTYQESPIENNPVVGANGDGWTKNGMHHIDIHPLNDDSFIISLDGNGFGKEEIVLDF
ncbi:glucosamine inositolphosphorylceramide transferase family protein [Ulvibacter litoralis]|uniref:Glucosamine inositolphosphorylceramide transferase 1 N-terminal domain-containing protein n=1 Tax=Ulvibacter litoralis TaxID=227084 RepID=A0A1G7GWG1_9FLAO|nr:hypothetical protein [Ulvibacter litoralis]GHC59864.1 hypothetical protein GCM10008083_26030 [Ulvibacter litoralis]SDE92496.1 hypothetical protein SAMN05421855_103367 [Ulvibacter litoralis]